MNYVDGPNLGDLIAARQTPLDDLLRILEETARAVAYAHSTGVVHRDLKPANILVDPEGRALLTDFGLARDLETHTPLTRTGSMMGTPQYMSPEQVEGKTSEVGPLSDVFSLGLVLYELLTGRLPFEADTTAALLQKIMNEDPKPPSRLAPNIPTDLEAICMKALMKEKEHRYSAAQAFADDLKRFRNGEAILARPPSILYRVRKKLRKQKGAVIATAVSVLVLAAVLGVAVWKLGQKEEAITEKDRQLLENMREVYRSNLDAAIALRRNGELAGTRKYGEKVETACREVMKKLPGLAEPHYVLGRMYRALLQEEAALREQNAALGIDPVFGPALYERALLIGREIEKREHMLNELEISPEEREERTAALQARIGEDLEALDRVIQNPDSGIGEGELLCVRALLALREGQAEETKELLEKAIGLDPRLEEAYRILGVSFISTRQFREAVDWCTKGLELDRGYLPLLETRISALLQWARSQNRGEEEAAELYRRALKDCARILAMNPARVEGLVFQGQTYVRLGWLEKEKEKDLAAGPNWEEAEKAFTGAIALQSSNGEIHLWRGKVRMFLATERKEDPLPLFASALEDFDRAVEIYPKWSRAWVFRGNAHARRASWLQNRKKSPLADFRQAILDFSQALDLVPDQADILYSRAGTYIHWAMSAEDPVEMYRLALADFEKAVDLRPGLRSKVHRSMALCRRKIREAK
jgi:tetratricopeptide (TPR) repeat protein